MKDTQKTLQELFPNNLDFLEKPAEHEVKPTLKETERREVWDKIEVLGFDVKDLNNIIQNPIPLSRKDLSEWALRIEKLRGDLRKLQQDVINLVSDRI